MMEKKPTYYYLDVDELQHYAYMLRNGYCHKIVDLGFQKFLVFAIPNKTRIGIAWPTITGGLDGASTVADTILEAHDGLRSLILPHIAGSTISAVLFPRYAN